MLYKTLHDLQTSLQKHTSQEEIREQLIDNLIDTAIFATDDEIKKNARSAIRNLARKQGALSSSIHILYQAFGNKKVSGFTVPAINIRTLTYDTARILFRLTKQKEIGAMIFEIARSEIGYTNQHPDEYAVSILAAAIKENYTGPVFLQGDHFQFSARKYKEDATKELDAIKTLTKEAIEGAFYNIDIDASTLVDLSQKDLLKQQEANYTATAAMTAYIRLLQPSGINISIGGEIGHIGGNNSTVSDFEAFMDGYAKQVAKNGISKVSVQTGTRHGGIPLSDGKIADIALDFSVLQDIGNVARNTYRMGGAVQHGASTLPTELFGKFVEVQTLEIHLATGFQNIVYEHIPTGLREEIYTWLKTNAKDEWEEGWSEEQFLYKTRKKALGPFKEKLWHLTYSYKQPILAKLEEQFILILEKLHVFGTQNIISSYV